MDPARSSADVGDPQRGVERGGGRHLVRLSFEGHAGRPGQRGGSLPRDAAGGEPPLEKTEYAKEQERIHAENESRYAHDEKTLRKIETEMALARAPTSQKEAGKRLVRATGLDADHVGVANHPVAWRAAGDVAKTLSTMRREGYSMPSDLSVMIGNEPGGLTYMQTGAMIVRVPDIPDDVSFDEATRAVYGPRDGKPAYSAVQSLRDIVVHEMGHEQHRSEMTTQEWPPYTVANLGRNPYQVAETVSPYAGRHPQEFLAETFLRIYRGEKLDAEVLSLYDTMHGKYPIGRTRAGSLTA